MDRQPRPAGLGHEGVLEEHRRSATTAKVAAPFREKLGAAAGMPLGLTRAGRYGASRHQSCLGGLYSITSSAVTRRVLGISRPSVLRGFQVDDELVLGRQLHRQIGRLLAF